VSPRWIRRIVVIVFIAGIGGMIAGSIADNNGTAITFGLITAVAAIGLILVTSVAPTSAFSKQDEDEPTMSDATATDVEARVEALVAAGADETEVRQLVQRTIDMARGR
jgi:hypothetical protein